MASGVVSDGGNRGRRWRVMGLDPISSAKISYLAKDWSGELQCCLVHRNLYTNTSDAYIRVMDAGVRVETGRSCMNPLNLE